MLSYCQAFAGPSQGPNTQHCIGSSACVRRSLESMRRRFLQHIRIPGVHYPYTGLPVRCLPLLAEMREHPG
jgi:hypothetical protein